MFKLTPADLEYALAELRRPENLTGGLVDWQRELIKNSPDFWNFLMYRLTILRLSTKESRKPDHTASLANPMTILTLVYAPVYSANGYKLPKLTKSKVEALEEEYAKNIPSEEVFKAMEAIDDTWLLLVKEFLDDYDEYKTAQYIIFILIKTLLDELDLDANDSGSGTEEPDDENPADHTFDSGTDDNDPSNDADETKDREPNGRFRASQSPRKSPIRNKKPAPPLVTFTDVGGQREAKNELMELAEDLKNPDLCKKWGTRPVKGVCLNGPPGNGKTLLARALANAVEVRFFHTKVSDIYDVWVGSSERNVAKLFEEAKRKGGIIFFDEADALLGSRAHHSAQRWEAAVLAEINVQMDGFLPIDNVVVMFATNRIEDMDEAAIRAGRIDRIIQVPKPDEETRREVLEIHMRAAERVAERELFLEIKLETSIAATKVFSCSDVAEIVRRALAEKKRLDRAGGNPSQVTTEELMCEISKYERNKKDAKKIGFDS
jgi:SpoVK/Ycf46/Vps4 family AAA+-type ATPase